MDDGAPAPGPFSTGAFEIGSDGPITIVVGVDGSRTSLRAGAFALGHARRNGSRLLCVYVRPLRSLVATAPGGAEAAVAADSENAHSIAHQIEERAAETAVSMSFVECFGDPVHELARIADEVHADSVVVGASEQLGHRVAGSLAVRLVRAARWPVTVVP